ncbi:hypothetical protein ACRALDRAFT_205120 [Sodiomyces alcalophilus JCM 7366]|uniref:uncharacterized protein n=1 Tax=Sodiomyces alcalophilus JCM 7366 TaxID=591952 RepID=UPI0039B624D4
MSSIAPIIKIDPCNGPQVHSGAGDGDLGKSRGLSSTARVHDVKMPEGTIFMKYQSQEADAEDMGPLQGQLKRGNRADNYNVRARDASWLDGQHINRHPAECKVEYVSYQRPVIVDDRRQQTTRPKAAGLITTPLSHERKESHHFNLILETHPLRFSLGQDGKGPSSLGGIDLSHDDRCFLQWSLRAVLIYIETPDPMCIRYAKVRPTALCGNEHWTTLTLDKRNFDDNLWNLRFHTATSRPYCLAHPSQRAIPPYKMRGTAGPPRDEFWLLCPLARPRPGYALYDDDVSRIFDRLIATHEPICPVIIRCDEWLWDDPDAFLECEGCRRAAEATEGLDKEGPVAHRRRIREWRKYWGRQPLDPRRLLLEEASGG